MREVLEAYAIPCVDYVFIARNSTAQCNFKELKKDTVYAIKRINKSFLQKPEAVSGDVFSENKQVLNATNNNV